MRQQTCVLLIGCALLLTGCKHQLPKCDSKEAKDLMAQIVNQRSYSWGQFVDVSDIDEEAFNKDQQIRTCSASLSTTTGVNDIYYSINWRDRENNIYYLQMRTQ